MSRAEMDQDQDTTGESAQTPIKCDVEEHRIGPISSLPPEVILIIFSLVKDASAALEWTNVTHVCGYWRKMAINAPELWCNPPLANLPWTVEMLARSKQVEITLDSNSDMYYHPRKRINPSLEEAFRHAARIRHISFGFPYANNWWPWVVVNLPVSAPCLETLFIELNLFEESNLSIREGTLVDVPNLRQLELTGCGPNWDAHWLPQITHLNICDIENPEQLTWTQLMTALGKMHNLESLTLSDAIPSNTITFDELDQTPLTHINLAQLRMLSIRDDFPVAERFFRSITFPLEAAVHVDSFNLEELSPEADGVRFATILRNIVKSYSNAASLNLVFKTLVVDYPNETPSEIRFGMFDDIFEESADIFGRNVNLWEGVKSDRRGLSLTFETYLNPPSASWFNAVFPGIFSAGLPLDDISHVHLRSRIPLKEHPDTPRFLTETIGQLPALSFINLKISGLIITPDFLTSRRGCGKA